MPASRLIKLENISLDALPVLISGVSASLALRHAGRMTTKEKVLVTGGATSTGQFAIQLAKAAGNHVVAVCSSSKGEQALQGLRCDRIVNSSADPVGYMLAKEYPSGFDLIVDVEGGPLLQTCVDHIAEGGRLVVFRSDWMLHPHDGGSENELHEMDDVLAKRGASARAFSLFQCDSNEIQTEIMEVCELVKAGVLSVIVDATPFEGLEALAGAVDRVLAKENVGKVVVRLAKT